MIKEYQPSANLFDKDNATAYDCYIVSNGQWAVGVGNKTVRISCSSNTQYTLSTASTYAAFRIMETGSDNIPSDGSPVNGTLIYYGSGNSYTFTTSNTAKYIIFQANSASLSQWLSELMFNTGSTALPYEPYGNTWNTKSYCKATTGSKTYSNFPIVVRSREQSIPSWNMKGNEQHTGTASPTSPIEINGTGDRTANLCSGIETPTSNLRMYIADFKTIVDDYSTFTISFTTDVVLYSNTLYLHTTSNEQIGVVTTDSSGKAVVSFTLTSSQISAIKNASSTWIYVYKGNADFSNTTNVMINLDSTALPYEPYGYKIPISANGTALTPVYLTEPLMLISTYADSLASSGTVTRNIKKLVLDGTELWQFSSSDSNRTVCYINHSMSNVVGYCSHILWKSSYETSDYNRVVYLSSQGGLLYISLDNALLGGQTLQDFKTYLQQQYAAGTPVTVYYVLATPTTEQVTVPTIPTTSSPTTIDVNTSVKPSEMSLTYDGYKICKLTKIVIPEPSEWIAKSWNGYNGMVGSSIWSDGDNIYYSMAMYQYVLNKSTSTWSDKTWNGLTSFNGANIWTDGDNVYYSFGDDQYVLNRQTSTWSAKTWKGLTSFDGGYVWTDGDNIYYSSSSNQYILDKATSTWVEKEWNGLTSFNGSSVWFEGNNIYYSYGLTRYVLNKSTSTWSEKVWTNAPYYMDGGRIWSVNGYTFYSNGTYEQYVLDKSTSTWSTKTWTGFTSFSGRNIWTDGTNIYVSDGNGKQYVLVR